MNKEEKIKIVGSLTHSLTENKNIYLADISGLDAAQTSQLRRMCFDQGVVLSVVKNTLLKKAMDACEKDFSSLESTLKGNTALMIAEASSAPAKVLKAFLAKTKLEKPNFKGGYVEESIYLGHDQLDILASLKSKEELISELMGLLKSPIVNLISSLNSSSQNISGILKSLENNPVGNQISNESSSAESSSAAVIESDKTSNDENVEKKSTD